MKPETPPPRPPLWAAQIYIGPHAEQRVRRLGVPQTATLADAVLAGAAGARAVMGYPFPPSYAGERMWGETHAALVSNLEPYGFSGDRPGGVDIVLNKELGIAIIVTASTSAAGRPEVPNPGVRYPRKQAVQALVNGEYDSLFDEQRPAWKVWFLLHHVDAVSVSAELSRPQGISRRTGQVVGWPERVMIPMGATPPGRGADEEPAAPVSPFGDLSDLAVRRRSS
jgi:hypothetical protein